MGQDGKTLSELLVVLGLVAVVAALAVPNFSLLHSRTHMRTVTQDIASELRLARQLAMTSKDRVRLIFDRERRAIVAELVEAARTHHVYRYEGIELEEPTAGPAIVFHPSGRSASATTIALRHRDGHVQKLTVSLTGRVSLS
jgi:type IV fimbrial biogenesis protein FimT